MVRVGFSGSGFGVLEFKVWGLGFRVLGGTVQDSEGFSKLPLAVCRVPFGLCQTCLYSFGREDTVLVKPVYALCTSITCILMGSFAVSENVVVMSLYLLPRSGSKLCTGSVDVEVRHKRQPALCECLSKYSGRRMQAIGCWHLFFRLWFRV